MNLIVMLDEDGVGSRIRYVQGLVFRNHLRSGILDRIARSGTTFFTYAIVCAIFCGENHADGGWRVVAAGKYADEMQDVQTENENPKTGFFACFWFLCKGQRMKHLQLFENNKV